jgi:molybdopterin/thiamine biosynthesis adenylyltransferase
MYTNEEMFNRSFDFYSKDEFKKIQEQNVLVAGVGGMGGVCCELLVRLGFINFTIADFDYFEISNTNRQIYCNTTNLNKNKIDVLVENFKSINPNVKIVKLPEGITDENRSKLVESHTVIVNGIDDIAHSILLRREVHVQNKFMVDAWLTPVVNTFVVEPNSKISPEDFMGYPSKDLKHSDEFTEEIRKACLKKDIEYTRKHFPSDNILSDDIVDKIINFEFQRHFPSMVWMCGCQMSNEVFKYVTKKGKSPGIQGVFFDYMNIPSV